MEPELKESFKAIICYSSFKESGGKNGRQLGEVARERRRVIFYKMGLSKGQNVLDFGCGTGNYAIPAAVIVGREGRVYALDKERRGFWPSEGLDKLIHRAESRALQKMVVMKTSGELKPI